MLRKADNVTLTFQPTFFGRSGYRVLKIGRTVHRIDGKIKREEFQSIFQWSAVKPVCVVRIGPKAYWLYQDRWHWEDEGMSPEDLQALLTARDIRREAQIKRAHGLAAMGSVPDQEYMRVGIPEDLRLLVMRRDGGRCRRCGAQHELQLDHIIPVSRGGATTPENLEVLCGPCNRSKGASIV